MEIDISLAVEDARDAGDRIGVELTRDDLQVIVGAACNEIAHQAIVEQFKAIIRATKTVLSETDDPVMMMASKFHLNLMENYLKEVRKNEPKRNQA